MGKRSSYPPGTFSWVDLATTDVAVAKSFYGGLFGWQMQTEDAGEGDDYITCRLDGDAVCGIFEFSEEMRAMAVPPNWTSYVTVADVDAATARVGELGGEVIRDAFDVLDAGRMALLEDPQGAAFAVWQARERFGAERVNDVGCLCMNELGTTDMDAAGSFYGDLFGWTTEAPDDAPEGLRMVLNDGEINGALLPAPEAMPPHWRPCFTVESVGAASDRVRELGGQRLGEPLDVGHGEVAMVLDPQGALFTMFAGEVDP